jgi:hypothetical protein
MAPPASMKIPQGVGYVYDGLTEMTDSFCAAHLNEEYAELSRLAIAALCRKRPTPLTSGAPQTWACAVVYALGQINCLTDRTAKPYMAMADICAEFGVASSTAAAKAKLVRKALGASQFDPTWMLPSRAAAMPLGLLLRMKGFVIHDLRLPEELLPTDRQPASDAPTGGKAGRKPRRVG